uniref:AlNc14C338G10760 protein n=1 Tax=Albugo laibachii Nc14 TaxID=890382 RepID=F0WWZ9_9STRA|nr:AlNc14C338G10760 [Albugo laibachii Nc14]|eukprot:CCA25985.1 AlNc14C338G10760 [Albugo laibachii Nc14]
MVTKLPVVIFPVMLTLSSISYHLYFYRSRKIANCRFRANLTIDNRTTDLPTYNPKPLSGCWPTFTLRWRESYLSGHAPFIDSKETLFLVVNAPQLLTSDLSNSRSFLLADKSAPEF